MRTAGIIPVDPLGDRAPCFLKTGEIVLPDTFFLQAPKEAFNDTVLFRRVRRDKLLCKFIITACFTEASALEHQAVITADNRHSFVRAQRAETFDAGIFKCPFGFSGPSSKGKLEADQFTIAAVDDSNEVSPAISAAGDMRYVSRPTHIDLAGLASTRLNPWLGAGFAVSYLPTVGGYEPMDGTLSHDNSLTEAKQCPQSAIPVCRMPSDQRKEPVR